MNLMRELELATLLSEAYYELHQRGLERAKPDLMKRIKAALDKPVAGPGANRP